MPCCAVLYRNRFTYRTAPYRTVPLLQLIVLRWFVCVLYASGLCVKTTLRNCFEQSFTQAIIEIYQAFATCGPAPKTVRLLYITGVSTAGFDHRCRQSSVCTTDDDISPLPFHLPSQSAQLHRFISSTIISVDELVRTRNTYTISCYNADYNHSMIPSTNDELGSHWMPPSMPLSMFMPMAMY